MSSTAAHEPFRARVHGMLRAAVLDAAATRAAAADWADVRISDIADDVGVSRQTIYNEFGAKDQLGLALFSREMDAFRAGVVEAAESAPDFATAIRTSVTWTLAHGRNHPIMRRILESSQEGGDASLLPLLTIHSQVVIRPFRQALVEAYMARWPADQTSVEVVTDLVIRLILSHILAPSDYPEDVCVDRIVAMVLGSLERPPAGRPETVVVRQRR